MKSIGIDIVIMRVMKMDTLDYWVDLVIFDDQV